MKFKLKVLAVITIVFLLLFYFIGSSGLITISIKNTELTQNDWQEDYAYLREELPKKHCHLFAKISQNDWNQAMDSQDNWNNPEVNLLKCLAMVGDAHTTVENYSDGKTLVYPFKIIKIKEKFYLYDTIQAYQHLIGKEVFALNDVAITKVYELMRAYISYENESRMQAQFTLLSNDYRLLSALNVGKGDVVVKFLDTKEKFLPTKQGEIAFLKNESNDISTFFDIGEDCLVVKLNAHLPFNTAQEGLGERLSEKQYKTIIIDLSDDVGGTYNPDKDKLVKLIADKISSQGIKCYVVIGRNTFSSGVLQAYKLKTLGATLVGEPTGGALDHFGDRRQLSLPHSHLIINYSTKFFNLTGKGETTLKPDIELGFDETWFFREDDKERYTSILEEVAKR